MGNSKFKTNKFITNLLCLSLFCSLFLMGLTVPLAESAQKVSEPLEPNIGSFTWWDADWIYSLRIEIVNNGDLLLDYQVQITLDPSNFNYSLANLEGDDIRFTSIDNSSILRHWIEEWNYEGTSIVWVKATYLFASTTRPIIMYYGNDLATSTSNGSLVFDVFDDFSSTELNLDLWNITEYTDGISNYELKNGELHTNMSISGYGYHSGFVLRLKQNSTYENFVITLKSRWDNLDYYRGYGVFNGPLLRDADGDTTDNAICLWGDHQVALHQTSDGTGFQPNIADYSTGSSYYEYKGLNDDFDLALSGTYDSNLEFITQGFNRPFTTYIYSMLSGRDESPVSVDVYFDFFYIRNNTAIEPIVYVDSIGEEPIIDSTSPVITLDSPVEYGTYSPSTEIFITVTDANNLYYLEYSWDQAANFSLYIPLNSTFTAFLPEVPGVHILEIFAADIYGNTAYEYFLFSTESPHTATPIPETISPTTFVVGLPLFFVTLIVIGVLAVDYRIFRRKK